MIHPPLATFALEASCRELARRFTESFPAQRAGPRTVGREAEFPIVTATGEAADARRLWDILLQRGDLEPEYGAGPHGLHDLIVGLTGPDYSYALEVGLGTMEISTRPCRDLREIERLVGEAVHRLVHAAHRFGWHVLGYGIQPVTPPHLRILSPKQRYLSLYRAMGAPWLWYTVTAADQLHVSIARNEMVDLLNFGNLMAPVIIALCGNSPVYGGAESPFCSAREGVMAEIRATEHRHGMLARPFASMVDFVETMSESTYLIVRAGGEIIPSSQPFTAFLAEHGPDYKAFLFHEHYIWNSARLRAAYGTLEVRPACQQPWGETMAVAALILGLVEAAEPALEYVAAEVGDDYWARLRIYHQQAIRFGLAAPQPAPDFLLRLAELAEKALTARGFGEETLLQPIFARLRRRMNPAQAHRAIYRHDGMAGLVRATTIH